MANLATLVAHLTADTTGFKTGLDSAQRNLNSFGARARTTQREAQTAFAAIGGAWTSTAGVLATVGLTLGLGGLIRDARDFERAMISLQRLTQANNAETREAAGLIRAQGLAWGVGARGAGQAARELLKVGATLEDLNEGALESTIVLARAQGASFEEAASIAGRAMTVFGLQATDLDDIVQGVHATVNAGSFELTDYAQALQQGGAAARDAGLTLDEFNAVLAVTQRALGSTGSDTGTSLRTFLSFLVPKSEEAAAAMRQLNLEFFNAEGAFVGIEEAATRLNTAFAELTDEERRAALRDILGQDAARQGIALINASAEGIRAWREEIASGASVVDAARGATEGFAGATDNLSSSFQDLGIAIGESGLMDLMAALTNWAAGGIQTMTRGVEGFSDDAAHFARGATSIWENRQLFDPLDYRINRLALERRRENPALSYPDARRQIITDPETIARLLNEEINRVDVMPWNDMPGQFYRSTPMGRELQAMMLDQLSIAPYDQNSLPSVDPGADLRFPAAPRPPRPPSDRDAARLLRDQNRAYEDDLDFQLWLGDIERNLGAWSKEHQIELDGVKVEIESLTTEDERLKHIAEGFAFEVNDTLRNAFVSNEWDWDSIGDSSARSFRATLWDAFLGNSMQNFAESLAHGLAGMFSRVQSTAQGATPGAGFTGWIDDLLGGPSTGLGKKGKPAAGGFGAIVGDVVGAIFGGFFAEGGYLKPGQWGIAGENGPEPIFAGPGGLSVLPSASGDGGGTVTNVFNIDARGGEANLEARLRIAVEEAAAIGAAQGAALKAQRERQSQSL